LQSIIIGYDQNRTFVSEEKVISTPTWFRSVADTLKHGKAHI